MHDQIKNFLVWITGDGKFWLFAIPPAIFIAQAVRAAVIGYKVGRYGAPPAAKTEQPKPAKKRRDPVIASLVFVFLFFLIAKMILPFL